MRAHQLRRHELQKAALDSNTADRIDIVACPKTVCVPDNTRVNTTASARARLNLDMRKGRAQPFY